MVDFDDQTGEGDVLGETPIAIDIGKLKKQYIRVWGEGVQSQYWIVKPMTEGKNELTIKVERKEEHDDGEAQAKIQEQNRAYRMLLRAYKALTAKDWESTREISKQMSQTQPDAAAPHLLTGLSFLAEGNANKARASFLKAKNLDPEDRDIDELIRLSKK
ncbi:MAG: hypothetical protein H7318_17050 [Oligoflexus sp.]|nr:hypothetical protein [Oligoflexus sp.]